MDSVLVSVQELCESRGGRPGLPVLMNLMVSVDVKEHWTMHTHWSQFVPNTCVNPTSEDIKLHVIVIVVSRELMFFVFVCFFFFSF